MPQEYDADLVAGIDALSDEDLMDAVSGVDYVGEDNALDLLDAGVGQALAVRRPPPTTAVKSMAARLKKLIKARGLVVSNKRAAALERRSLAGKQPCILLGIDSEVSLGRDVAANETITIATEAVDRMRIIDFQVRAAIAGDFLIGRIQVQRTNLLSGGHPVPADIFAAPDRPPLESPVLYPGTELLVEIINLVGAARRFTGQFRGIDLDED